MRRLVDHGRAVRSSFFFREFAAPAGCGATRPPGRSPTPPLTTSSTVTPSGDPATKMRENAFRRYRLGQWVQLDGYWLPDGAWAACANLSSIEDGADVVLGFDGSFSGDCTALVAVTVADRPHVHLVRLWEAPEGSGLARARGRGRGHHPGRLPPLAGARGRRRPYRWQRSLELLDAEGIPVGEYPQSQQDRPGDPAGSA